MGYFVEERCDFKDFCNSVSIGLIEFFRVEFDSGFDGEEVDDGSHELNSIFFFVDII